jgi:hypothetical protein
VKPADRQRQASEDAAKAIRFMAVKAAIFILVPLVIAVIAVYFTLK